MQTWAHWQWKRWIWIAVLFVTKVENRLNNHRHKAANAINGFAGKLKRDDTMKYGFILFLTSCGAQFFDNGNDEVGTFIQVTYDGLFHGTLQEPMRYYYQQLVFFSRQRLEDQRKSTDHRYLLNIYGFMENCLYTALAMILEFLAVRSENAILRVHS